MNRYTIEDNGKRYVVEAESEEQALSLIASQSGPTKKDLEMVERSELVQGRPNPLMVLNPMNYLSTPQQKLDAVKELAPAALEMAKSAGLRGGPAAGGAYLGASAGPVGMAIGGGIGALIGSVADQKRIDGDVRLGETLADTGMGMIPGSSLAKAPASAVAKRAAVEGGLNLASGTAQTLIDEGRLPTAGEAAIYGVGGAMGPVISRGIDSGAVARAIEIQKGQEGVLRETLAIGKGLAKEIAEDASIKQGYILPPALVAPNSLNKLTNSVAGAADTVNHAVKHNQRVTNAALRKQFKLDPSEPWTLERIMELKQAPNAVYEKIGSVSDDAKTLIEEYKRLHSEAQSRAAQYYNSEVKDPDLLAQAKNLRELAKTTKSQLAAELQFNPFFNRKQADALMDEFNEAERQRARIGVLEQAFRPTGGGDGNISAKVIGDIFESEQDVLDGALYNIGRFENAFKNLLAESAGRPNPGVNHLGTYLAGGLGWWGASQFGPGGLALSAAPMAARELTRRGIMSPAYQSTMVRYGYGMPSEDFSALMARISAGQQSRKGAEALDAYANRIYRDKTVKGVTRDIIKGFAAGLR